MKVKGITKMKDLQAADDRTEEQIQEEIIKYLSATVPPRQGYFYRSKSGTGRSKPRRGHHRTESGQPDITGFYMGFYIGLEVKRPKGTLGPSQIRFQERAAKSGAIYRVVTSVEDAQRVIEEVSG